MKKTINTFKFTKEAKDFRHFECFINEEDKSIYSVLAIDKYGTSSSFNNFSEDFNLYVQKQVEKYEKRHRTHKVFIVSFTVNSNNTVCDLCVNPIIKDCWEELYDIPVDQFTIEIA